MQSSERENQEMGDCQRSKPSLTWCEHGKATWWDEGCNSKTATQGSGYPEFELGPQECIPSRPCILWAIPPPQPESKGYQPAELNQEQTRQGESQRQPSDFQGLAIADLEQKSGHQFHQTKWGADCSFKVGRKSPPKVGWVRMHRWWWTGKGSPGSSRSPKEQKATSTTKSNQHPNRETRNEPRPARTPAMHRASSSSKKVRSNVCTLPQLLQPHWSWGENAVHSHLHSYIISLLHYFVWFISPRSDW